jgi:hypothetical protein
MNDDAFDRFDDMAERTIWPHCDDYHDDTVDPYWNDEDDGYDDNMDGDFDSAMRDAGFGTDENYGTYDSGDDW